MIQLNRHVEILLLSNDCVIVPELGGFMAHHICSRYDEEEQTFLPPIRTVGFNPQLTMNDSLLVQSYIEAYDVSYPEALRMIEDEVAELKGHLEADGSYELTGVGTISINESTGHLEFEPCEAGILTPQLYGLGTFEMRPLEAGKTKQTDSRTANQPNDQATEHPSEERAIVIKMSHLRRAVAAVAAVVLFLLMATPVENGESLPMAQESAIFPSGSRVKAPAVAAPTAPAAESESAEAGEAQTPELQNDQAPGQPNREKAAPAPADDYTIVMASQTTLKNAHDFVDYLLGQGLSEAKVTEGSMVRVVYGSYASELEARQTLLQLRKQHGGTFAQSWVMKVNKDQGK